MTNQVCPIDNDQSVSAVERYFIARTAYATLTAATSALDWVEATGCADVADPATDPVYGAVDGPATQRSRRPVRGAARTAVVSGRAGLTSRGP